MTGTSTRARLWASSWKLLCVREQRLADFFEEGLLERDGAVLRADGLVLEGLQLLRDVALGRGRRLLARPPVVGRTFSLCALVTSM
jgi:hypothetical protein